MNENIFPEAGFFAVSFITGAGLMAAYDLILIIRFFIRHNRLFIAVEDVLYWCCAGILSFIMMYNMNFGIIRGFAIATIFIGMIIYRNIRNIILMPLKKILYRVKMPIKKRNL